ncbi:TPA: EAL domain-containing protein [Vibrio vulnificus]|nr:EAL domain-containing protein [Vibrio vulnificus]HDY8012845.1 EAL domain-containing protein [Vibrio vulnificus]
MTLLDLNCNEAKNASSSLVFSRAELSSALRHEQIVAHFQPIIELESAAVVGAEALVRWEHPFYGLLLPKDFIDYFKRFDLASSLTALMLERSLMVLQQIPDIYISINVSPDELLCDDFVDYLCDIVEETPMLTERLRFEVTEQALSSECCCVLASQIAKLKNKGLSLSIDDFGTGFSSLKRLLTQPFNELKIDMFFVKNMSDARCKEVIGYISNLASSLQMTTVAEGVETKEEAEKLSSLGIHKAQGYFYSPSLCSESLKSFMLHGES